MSEPQKKETKNAILTNSKYRKRSALKTEQHAIGSIPLPQCCYLWAADVL